MTQTQNQTPAGSPISFRDCRPLCTLYSGSLGTIKKKGLSGLSTLNKKGVLPKQSSITIIES